MEESVSKKNALIIVFCAKVKTNAKLVLKSTLWKMGFATSACKTVQNAPIKLSVLNVLGGITSLMEAVCPTKTDSITVLIMQAIFRYV